jgi:hypothetical protein
VNDRKDALPLRVIAARFVSTDEKTGLTELDRITADVSRLVQKRYWLLWAALIATLFAALITLVPGIVLTFLEISGAEVVVIIGLMCFGLLMAVLASWRIFQYGGMKATAPQEAVYADPDDPAVRNLERLFAILQLESTPRAFYRTRSGTRRYVDERYFFGSLRAAYVAKDNTIRDALFGPIGFWFTRELFLETDVDELIARAKAKPNRAGTPKTYDYTDAVMSLIEHPAVRAVEVGKRGNQKRIVGLLEDWYRDRRLPVPSETQLSLYAKQVLGVIAKNRAAKS